MNGVAVCLLQGQLQKYFLDIAKCFMNFVFYPEAPQTSSFLFKKHFIYIYFFFPNLVSQNTHSCVTSSLIICPRASRQL